MLTLTSPVETPLHRLPAGPKLAALCVLTVALFSLRSPLPLAAAVISLLAVQAGFGRVFARASLGLLRPLWPFVLIVALWHLAIGDPKGGAVVILRLLAAVMAANLVTMTTRLTDMIALLDRLARPLAPLGLPPRRLALAIGLVIRFIPVLTLRTAQLAEAWQARATAPPRHRLLAPAALAALDEADHVAEALRARGGAG